MKPVRIHLIGIGGVGMAGLAVLLKAQGHEVSGCDLKATPRTRWLESQGVSVFVGHSPDHLKNVDEVIVTPAVARDNPERQACANPRFRGEVLAELVNASDGIAVCGSHGKTTTATWIAKLLQTLGESVSWCIGGETGAFPVAHAAAIEQSNNLQSNNSPLVVEADESDGTLALYHAKTLVVNKCEYDHPDHFKTEADYFACYETAKRNAETVIESEKLDWELFDCSDCSIVRLRGLLNELPDHNRKNARAAIEVALRRGHRLEDIAKALPSIVSALPDRRFERVWPQSNNQTIEQSNNLLVYTDYAHHPTEMACAVGMARKICRGTLRVLFQPHRYSRTKALLKDFPAAFEGADEVVLCPTYAAFEQPIEGGDIADLYRACREHSHAEARIPRAKRAAKQALCGVRRRGRALLLSRSCEEAWEHAFNSMQDGDLTLLLGAGDIINLVPQVRQDLISASLRLCGRTAPSRPPRKIWIGQGSNTWKSDLNLSVEYVKTSGPAGAPGASLGISWMAGIPGTVGGWIKMNAGAFGHSISEVLAEVKVDGRWLPASACGFSYRHSDITGEIQDFKLKVKESGEGEQRKFTSSYFLAKRKKFPAGTYGSFFKNPEGDFAGRLLEEAGAKELRVGGAYVWSEHANVIVRGEGATASDVLALARLMRNRVFFRFGIRLEPEVQGIVF